MQLDRGTIVHPDWPRWATQPTADDTDAVWIADESGTSGENLVDRDFVVAHAAVRVDDWTAEPILEHLKERVGATEAAEAKFSQFAKDAGLEALAETFGPGGALDGLVTIVVADKPFVIVAKIVDLIVEEWAHERGVNLYAGGNARQMALTLSRKGPRVLGELWDPLMAAFVSLARTKQRKGAKETVASFYARLGEARRQCWHRDVGHVLDVLLESKRHAEALVRFVADETTVVATMDPMGFLLGDNLAIAHHKHGPIRVLHDEQNILTHAFVEGVLMGVAASHVTFGRDGAPPVLADFCVGHSRNHHSIQLADLAASSGRVIVEAHLGKSSRAADVLREVVSPSIVHGVLRDGDVFWADQSK
ncbi:hypothetical protein [Kribbella sp. VKM Ac-2568]|uniref:hypothetical protein n=1 Tax=Kribbella sp. VKM Ac-2568 TaxID=2512219 RepID=UPI00105399F4|nr:hypothetical protein [Kribbella sp. VKM Ac-2568]TCM36004.1 hypothetical protein EV648_12352 [Kribbella sp. VKM Ac-2568]